MKLEDFIQTQNRGVHMVGDYVAVCCNLRRAVGMVIVDGVVYPSMEMVEVPDLTNPYIDFVDLRKDDRTGEMYEDEDSPVDGGIDKDTAEKVAHELLEAVKYIRGAK